MNRVADTLVAEVARRFETTEEEDSSSGAETQEDAEQASLIFTVVFRIFNCLRKLLVCRVSRIQETKETARSKGATDSIQDEDGNNQQRKDVISKLRGQFDVAGQIKKCREA